METGTSSVREPFWKQNMKTASKSIKLLKFFAQYHLQKRVFNTNPEKLARWVKDQLLKLGPTFIKVGQFISTRADIFDKELVQELKTLQDHVPAFPAKDVHKIIERELNAKMEDVFSEFDDVPLGVASVGQVHRARLKTGEDVVVKVKRPEIKGCIEDDYRSLKLFLDVAAFFNQENSDTRVIVTDLYTTLMTEVSFEEELKNLLVVADNSFGENVMIPTPYEDYCTDEILVLQYIESTKITSIDTPNPKLAHDIMTYFFNQICEHGIIHADPHPGNIGVVHNDTIVLYDFGQVLRMDDQFLGNVKLLMYAIYKRNSSLICKLLVDSNIVFVRGEKAMKNLEMIVENIVQYCQNMKYDEMCASFASKQLKVMEQDDIEINGKVVMLLRCITLLEGVCMYVDPLFNYTKILEEMFEGVM